MAYNTGYATLAAQWVRDFVTDATTKTVCLTALDCVGRLKWQSGMTKVPALLPGNTLNAKGIGCVCYEAPVAFAVMAGALALPKATIFDPGTSNEDIVAYIYDRLVTHIRFWKNGDPAIPAGAMVFHQRKTSETDFKTHISRDVLRPCAHVTLSVGNRNVVSCWSTAGTGPGIADGAGLNSEAYRIYLKEVQDLNSKHLSADTVVLPQTAFTNLAKPEQSKLAYTNGPFWTLW